MIHILLYIKNITSYTFLLDFKAVESPQYILNNFAKFTGKDSCWLLFFSEVARMISGTLLKKKRRHWCFPVNFAKFLGATI